MSLSPNPLTLVPGPTGTCGTVSNNDVANSEGQWTVFGAITQGGRPVSTAPWSFNPEVSPEGSSRLATLTLAPNSAEAALLAGGTRIVLAVQYPGIARLDFLTVSY